MPCSNEMQMNNRQKNLVFWPDPPSPPTLKRCINLKLFLKQLFFRLDPYMVFGLLSFMTFLFYVTFRVVINFGGGRSFSSHTLLP